MSRTKQVRVLFPPRVSVTKVWVVGGGEEGGLTLHLVTTQLKLLSQVLEKKQASFVPDLPPSLLPTSSSSSFFTLSSTSSPSPSSFSFKRSPQSPSVLLLLKIDSLANIN